MEVLRRYPLTYAHLYVLGLGFIAVAFFFITWLFAQGWWGPALYGLVMFCGLYIIFQTWYFARANSLVITTERAVDIARAGWFDEIVSSVGYADIMDVSFRKSGIGANIFNYGGLFLQTRSKQFILEISKIHQPQKAVNFLLEQIEYYRDGKTELTVEEIYENFIKIIPDLTGEELDYISEVIDEKRAEDSQI